MTDFAAIEERELDRADDADRIVGDCPSYDGEINRLMAEFFINPLRKPSGYMESED